MKQPQEVVQMSCECGAARLKNGYNSFDDNKCADSVIDGEKNWIAQKRINPPPCTSMRKRLGYDVQSVPTRF